MKTISRLMTLFALSALSSLLLSCGPTTEKLLVQPTVTASTALVALVNDRDGKPIEGVKLRFTHPLQSSLERQTDANGQANLQGLKAGIPYLLSVEGNNMVPRQQIVLVPENVQAKGVGLRLRVVLERAQTQLSGQILDNNGRPLAAAVVQAGPASIETGSDGRYKLALASQPGEVLAYKQGFKACVLQQGNCRLERQDGGLRLRTSESHNPLGFAPEAFIKQTSGLLSDSRAAGYQVLPWPGEALNPARDTLWLAAPAKPLSANEITQIGDFVKGGGKLVVNSEWAGFGQLELESLRSLLAGFGLAPGSDSLHQGVNLGIKLFEAHPLISGLQQLKLYRSGSVQLLLADQARLLAYSPAEGFRIAATGGHGVLACSLAGKGKIVALGDSSLWLEDDADGNGIANYREADNAKLWKNVLGW